MGAPQSARCYLRNNFKAYNYVIKYNYNTVGHDTWRFLKDMNLSEYYLHWGPNHNETMFDKATSHVTYKGGNELSTAIAFYGKYYDKDIVMKCLKIFNNEYKLFNLSYPGWIEFV